VTPNFVHLMITFSIEEATLVLFALQFLCCAVNLLSEIFSVSSVIFIINDLKNGLN
jgi:hypothetical protein